jgi:hypothetical protein
MLACILMHEMVVESRRNGYESQLFNLQQTEEGKYIVNNTVFEWQDKNSLESEGMLAVVSWAARVTSREEHIQDRHLCAQRKLDLIEHVYKFQGNSWATDL